MPMETPELNKLGIIFVCILLYIIYIVIIYIDTHPLRKIGFTNLLYNNDEDNYDKLIIEELTYNLSEFFICYNDLVDNNNNNRNLDSGSESSIEYLLNQIYKKIIYDKDGNIKTELSINADELDELVENKDILNVFNDLKSKRGSLVILNELELKHSNNAEKIKKILKNDFNLMKYVVPIKKYDDDDPIFNKRINFSQSGNDISFENAVEFVKDNKAVAAIAAPAAIGMAGAVAVGEAGEEMQKGFNELLNIVLSMVNSITKFNYNNTIKDFADKNDDILNYTTFMNVFINRESGSEGTNANIIFTYIDKLQDIISNYLNSYTKIDTKEGMQYFKKEDNIQESDKKGIIMKVLKMFYNMTMNLQIYLLNINKKYTITNLLNLFDIDVIKEHITLDLENANILNLEIEIKNKCKYYDISEEVLNKIKNKPSVYKKLYNRDIYTSKKVLDEIINMNINNSINYKLTQLLKKHNKEYTTNFLKMIRDSIVIMYTTVNLFRYYNVSIEGENDKLSKYGLISIIEEDAKSIINNEVNDLTKRINDRTFKFEININYETENKIKSLLNCLNFKINNILRLGIGKVNNIFIHKFTELEFEGTQESNVNKACRNDIIATKLKCGYLRKQLHINHIKYIVNNINFLFNNKIKCLNNESDKNTINKIENYIRLNNCLIYFRLFKRFYNNNIIKYSSLYSNKSNGFEMSRVIFWEGLFTKVYINSFYNYLFNRAIYTAQYINMFEPSNEYSNSIRESDNNNAGLEPPEKPNLNDVPIENIEQVLEDYNKKLEEYEAELARRPPMTSNPVIATSENVLYDHVEYYQKRGSEIIVNVMNSVFGKPTEPDVPKLVRPISMPWPLPDALGEIIAAVINAMKMAIYFIKKFVKLVRNFNDFLKFIAKISIYFALLIFLIIYEIVGRIAITGALLLKELITLFVYGVLGIVLASFNIVLIFINATIVLFSQRTYYSLYRTFMANEINPRSFYLNPNYFRNVYKKYPTLKKYLVGNNFNFDLYNNDNVNFGIFLLKGVNYKNNGVSYLKYNIDTPLFLKKKEYYLPSFVPEINILRSYMRNMYSKMIDKGDTYGGVSLNNEKDGLDVSTNQEYSYNLTDMGEDYYNYANEVMNAKNIKQRKERIIEIQRNRKSFYNNWLRFKNDVKKKDNDIYKIFNIDIEKLSTYIFKNLNLEYAKSTLEDPTENLDKEYKLKMYKDIDKIRDMYYTILLPYYNKHKCNSQLEHDYSKILQFHYNYYDYDTFITNINSDKFSTSMINIFGSMGYSEEQMKFNNKKKEELYKYYQKDILRKIIMNISILLIIIGLNNMFYEIL
jgi:hypothetical protein